MQRTLEPELLDSLPFDHPDALHNRRDLRLVNHAMGNHRWLARAVPALLRPGETVLEVGSGTGELGLQFARRRVSVDGLDLWPRPVGWPTNQLWHQADLRAFEGYANYPVIVGNLIFHQFPDSDLSSLGEKLRHSARVIVACEPHRRRVFQFLYRAFAPLFGANHVSLHDGHVSIAAGFCGMELAALLGLNASEWRIRCRSTLLGGYRMVAVRRT